MRRGLQRFGEAEVEHLDGAVFTHLDVRRFQVAVDDRLLVRRLERLGNLFRDRECVIDGQGSLSEPIGKRRPLHQLHDERRRRAGALQSVDSRDVGMVE
jgi:hypothetical protein